MRKTNQLFVLPHTDDGSEVSSQLWIYFVVTIPLTLAIVGSWWILGRRREKRYAAEDLDIEQGIERMETDILAIMRKKTMQKATTWDSGKRANDLVSPKTHSKVHNPFHSLEK